MAVGRGTVSRGGGQTGGEQSRLSDLEGEPPWSHEPLLPHYDEAVGPGSRWRGVGSVGLVPTYAYLYGLASRDRGRFWPGFCWLLDSRRCSMHYRRAGDDDATFTAAESIPGARSFAGGPLGVLFQPFSRLGNF